MRTNNTSPFTKKQSSSKKIKKLQAKDLFHKIASLSKIQKRVLNLFIYLSTRLRTMYMKQTWIAQIVGCCRKWAGACIAFLAELGFIYSKRRSYFHGWRTNLYAMKINFFEQKIRHELYTILSALREFQKKFPQLENEDNNIKLTVPIVREMVDDPPPKQEQPDVMSWTIDDIMSLRSKNNRNVVPSVDRSAGRTSTGFKKIGSFL